MRTVTLIRHAKSSWEDSSLQDLIRPLSSRGIENTTLLGNYIFVKKFTLDKILCSPATRAIHTAINLGDWIGYPHKNIKISKVLYYGKVGNVVKTLQQQNDKYNHICMVGHEPLLSELAEYLCGSAPEKFVTCGMLTIQFDVLLWEDINKCSGKMESFITPKYVHALQQHVLEIHV